MQKEAFLATRYRTASLHAHQDVLQMLLDLGADVNASGGAYGNALQAASLHGEETVVRILLEAGS